MIITSEKELRKPSVAVATVAEGLAVARKLTREIERVNKRGKQIAAGLSAPQIGIYKQVCVVAGATYPIVLINPRIVAHSSVKFPYKEACLSFPGREAETYRWSWVIVETLNSEPKLFGHRAPRGWDSPYDMLEAVVVQHEIDHLHGVLFFDRGKDE